MKEFPLISCICVLEDEALSLQRAVLCFERQDYPNKELIISYAENNFEARITVERLQKYLALPIITIVRPEYEKLKTAKNHAIESASGDFICIWNANSWHHSNRLSYQYKCISNGPFLASVLMYIFIYDPNSQQAYYSSYQEWEETIFCEKESLLKACYRGKGGVEQLTLNRFLHSRNLLFEILEAPHLYTCILDQQISDKAKYHYCLFKKEPLDEESNEVVTDLINPINYNII